MLPALADRDESAALVIRTDFGDEEAWQAVLAELAKPWDFDDDEVDPYLHVVDDPAWAGATADAVIAALSGDGEPGVVYLADRVTMADHDHALLAVAVLTREECETDEEFEADSGSVRTVPAGIGHIHANLMIANLGFGDVVEAARADPAGVFRSF
ncbi:DUF6924 domain-containing protein [Streptomyces sp. NRRL S-350]|uniref:DUF6924 domain-containing protein n=1 Tax=Streptomyces sp. NRRL S-350 TaxID=1463902 RepID=UPI0006923F32|nr:hypothetical protein [Streptomyces sp. NRRL S-350]